MKTVDAAPYYAALTLCRHCGYEWSAVFPVGTPAVTLECPMCRLQESEPIRYYPPAPYDFVGDVAEWHEDEQE